MLSLSKVIPGVRGCATLALSVMQLESSSSLENPFLLAYKCVTTDLSPPCFEEILDYAFEESASAWRGGGGLKDANCITQSPNTAEPITPVLILISRVKSRFSKALHFKKGYISFEEIFKDTYPYKLSNSS